MSKLIAFNKPFQVLCQFTDSERRATLADFIPLRGVYAAGRLDRDSEGLLLLTDNGRLQHRITDPRRHCWKVYWVQVEGIPTPAALKELAGGVLLKDGLTRPARAQLIQEPEDLWARMPPIRERHHIPTSWLQIALQEGRNRQIRRMTAAVGFPTLRLIRYAIAGINLTGLSPGQWRALKPGAQALLSG